MDEGENDHLSRVFLSKQNQRCGRKCGSHGLTEVGALSPLRASCRRRSSFSGGYPGYFRMQIVCECCVAWYQSMLSVWYSTRGVRAFIVCLAVMGGIGVLPEAAGPGDEVGIFKLYAEGLSNSRNRTS